MLAQAGLAQIALQALRLPHEQHADVPVKLHRTRLPDTLAVLAMPKNVQILNDTGIDSSWLSTSQSREHNQASLFSVWLTADIS
jgi:hypothetical protein